MVENTEITRSVAASLPYLRRYARALTGNQVIGDEFAARALEKIIHDKSLIFSSSSPKVGLFRAFHRLWKGEDSSISSSEKGLRGIAQKRMSVLVGDTRVALLLHTIESFDLAAVAEILDVSLDQAEKLVTRARSDVRRDVAGYVMIIEDEALIALDLEDLVAGIGHCVTGVARTRTEAADLAARAKPDLILADIRLADESCGIEAVRDILNDLGERPVIFVTAYPERFLTGERPEPAFLIAKPYEEEQIQSAVSQAMFFSSVETLKA